MAGISRSRAQSDWLNFLTISTWMTTLFIAVLSIAHAAITITINVRHIVKPHTHTHTHLIAGKIISICTERLP